MTSPNTIATAKVRVLNENGLHARPSALIAQTAKKFDCEIEISSAEGRVNARSIMGLITLCAFQGTEMQIWARGHDAQPAVQAIADLFNNAFDEAYK
ncbi:MAG: HPr family phosphocarrier protein [Verrucomicrobiota bacterium]|jgi:phosphocarrier protein|nr:HPr family phosphocarrier protein [Verrucomicrobiota bacterium]MDD8046608.1 HPr family phosphocarrier protein [Verrucomicrobiota bacterium]HCF94507.1 phosphocarrier protein HPr [Verrucomicrobiota bacterium]